MAPKIAAAKGVPLSVDEKKLLSLAQYLGKSVAVTDRGLVTGSHVPPSRVRTFRADKMIEFMADPNNTKYGLDKIKTRDDATKLASELLSFSKPRRVNVQPRGNLVMLFVRCERLLQPNSIYSMRADGLRLVKAADSKREFETGEDVRYMWLYEGDKSWDTLKLAGIVAAIIALCMFQLWPPIMRVAVWYISVTLLLALLLTTIVQLVVFGLSWLAGYELWVLPNLWSDTAMIWEVLTPVYTFKKAEGSAWYWRVGLICLLAASGYWLACQPNELEKFMATNKQFVEDLYAGTLLTDGMGTGTGLSTSGRGPSYSGPFGASYGPGSNRYGGRAANIPAFEDLEKMLKEEEHFRAKEQAEEAPADLSDSERVSPDDSEPAASNEPDVDAMVEESLEVEVDTLKGQEGDTESEPAAGADEDVAAQPTVFE